MARKFAEIRPEHRAFIAKQHVFFVASTAAGARINLSPKGLDALRVVDKQTAIYLDLTGSGNETAAHLEADGRLTLMVCAFEGAPQILRLYGRGRVLPRGSETYAALIASHFDGSEPHGARQMVRLDVELVRVSCGFGVPRYAYQGGRPSLVTWADHRTEAELAAFRAENSQFSIDGLPTGLTEAPAGAPSREIRLSWRRVWNKLWRR